VVFIAEQFEGKPVKSRMGVFPEIFSMTDSGLKNMESMSKPWVGWRLRLLVNFVIMGACKLSSKEDKVVL